MFGQNSVALKNLIGRVSAHGLRRKFLIKHREIERSLLDCCIVYKTPNNEGEFETRMKNYRTGKELRYDMHTRKTFEAYFYSRIMYYNSSRMLFFLLLDNTDLQNIGVSLPSIFSNLSKPRYLSEGFSVVIQDYYIRLLIINLRKYAEAAFYLDLLEEAEFVCNLNISIYDKWFTKGYSSRNKMLRLTFAILCKISLLKNSLSDAKKYLEEGKRGLTDGMTSQILENTQTFVEYFEMTRMCGMIRNSNNSTVIRCQSEEEYGIYAKEFREILMNNVRGLYGVDLMDNYREVFDVARLRRDTHTSRMDRKERRVYLLENFCDFQISFLGSSSAFEVPMEEVHNRNSDNTWCVFGMKGGKTNCVFYEKGDDYEELQETLNEEGSENILFAYVRWEILSQVKYVLISYCSNGIKLQYKRNMMMYNRDVDDFMRGRFHVKIDARNEDDIEEDAVQKKVKKAASSLYITSKKHPAKKPTGKKPPVPQKRRAKRLAKKQKEEQMIQQGAGKSRSFFNQLERGEVPKKTYKRKVVVPSGTGKVVGKEWSAKGTKKATKAFSGTHGKDWTAQGTKKATKAFSGSHGKDWTAQGTKKATKAFSGTRGQDWSAQGTKKATKAFSGTVGKDWDAQGTKKATKAFEGTVGQEWDAQGNQQVTQAYEGEYGEGDGEYYEEGGEGEYYEEGGEYYEEGGEYYEEQAEQPAAEEKQAPAPVVVEEVAPPVVEEKVEEPAPVVEEPAPVVEEPAEVVEEPAQEEEYKEEQGEYYEEGGEYYEEGDGTAEAEQPQEFAEENTEEYVEKPATVMYSFEATDAEELSIEEGESVTILKDVGDWLFIRNRSGAEGYVPATYVEEQE